MADDLVSGYHVMSTHMADDLILISTKMTDDLLMQNVNKHCNRPCLRLSRDVNK